MSSTVLRPASTSGASKHYERKTKYEQFLISLKEQIGTTAKGDASPPTHNIVYNKNQLVTYEHFLSSKQIANYAALHGTPLGGLYEAFYKYSVRNELTMTFANLLRFLNIYSRKRTIRYHRDLDQTNDGSDAFSKYCDWITTRPNYITDSQGYVVCSFGDGDEVQRCEVYAFQSRFTRTFGPINPSWPNFQAIKRLAEARRYAHRVAPSTGC